MSEENIHRAPRELVIYTDESDKQGNYFSNFYGGALIRSHDLKAITQALEKAKLSQNLLGEVKWQRVTENYLEKYKYLMSSFFDFVAADRIKVRIMFTQNRFVPIGLSSEQKQNEFHLLYYQFLKHAFGLTYANSEKSPLRVKINLDQLPTNAEQNAAFKSFILRLNFNPQFRAAKLEFSDQQIAEVSSKEHVLLQCLDVVLGAMCFRLNDKHLEKPAGQHRRGRRTVAKEDLYNFIAMRVRAIYPGFNIGESTGTNGEPENRWRHPYRHWKFVPQEHEVDGSKTKQK